MLARQGNYQWVLGVLAGAVLGAMVLLARHAFADDRDKIIGTWKLVSVLYEDVQTKERTPVLGEHPKGCQIATPKGRWLALVTGEGRKVPENDADRGAALRSMIAYTGRYQVEGGKITTKVEAAWNEAWVGTEQERFYKFEGDRLLLESPPQPHPNLLGKVVRIVAVWEREE
jgi:hypothetical protein